MRLRRSAIVEERGRRAAPSRGPQACPARSRSRPGPGNRPDGRSRSRPAGMARAAAAGGPGGSRGRPTAQPLGAVAHRDADGVRRAGGGEALDLRDRRGRAGLLFPAAPSPRCARLRRKVPSRGSTGAATASVRHAASAQPRQASASADCQKGAEQRARHQKAGQRQKRRGRPGPPRGRAPRAAGPAGRRKARCRGPGPPAPRGASGRPRPAAGPPPRRPRARAAAPRPSTGGSGRARCRGGQRAAWVRQLC